MHASDPGSDRIFPRWLVALAGIFAIGFLLWVLRGALTPVFFAFLIAYMLDPVVDRFEARNLPRGVGIAVMLGLVFGAIVLFVGLALPGIVRDVAAFFRELPATLDEVLAQIEPWLAEMGVELPQTVGDAMQQWHIDSEQIAKAVAPAGAVIMWILGGTANALAALAGLVMIPVFAAYLLHDFDRIVVGVRDLVPQRWRPFVVDVAREVDQVLGAFIRGQLIVMVILAVLYGVSYALLGVRLGVVIGIVAGLSSFIPYVGGAVALGLAVIMCLLDWGGWLQLGGVVVVYSLIQVLEGFVITPKIVGDKVGLSAVWVLFALVVGGDLFGFMGVLLSLPAAAVAKVFVVRGLAWYRASSFFRGDGPEPGPVLAEVLRAEADPDDATRAAKQGHPPEAPPPGEASTPRSEPSMEGP